LPNTTTRWRGVAPEDRRAERRRLLMDAAFGLLGTAGWSGTSVRAVCQRAELNPRYFYESFDDLDALVVAVYDRVIEEMTASILAAIDGAPDAPADQLRAVVAATVTFMDEDRRRARVVYVEALGNEALNRRRIDTGHETVAFVQAFGPPGESDHLGAVAAPILVGGFSELLVSWLEGRLALTREQLIDDATKLFLALAEAAAPARR
jgi:AcrR family transcriptional regulator